MDKPEKISGVFSVQEVHKVGTGTTTRKTIRKTFWYCVEVEGGSDAGKIEVQPLTGNYVPSGPKRIVERDKFLSEFAPEPEFYMSTVYPRMREITKAVARAERHRAQGELFSAEMEFSKAIQIDEENVRANFGLGLTYMARGELAKAENILSRLVKLEAAFDPEHKHLFNEFGMELRKKRMFKEAIDYYVRALELSPQDENLYYNIARANLENENPAAAAEYLIKGIEVNPMLEESVKFMLWLLSKDMVPQEKRAEAVQALKKAQEAMKNQAADPAVAAAEQAAPVAAAPAEPESKASADNQPA